MFPLSIDRSAHLLRQNDRKTLSIRPGLPTQQL